MTDPAGAPAGDPRICRARGAQGLGEAAAPVSLPPGDGRSPVPVELADLRRATVAYLSMLSETAAVIVAMGPNAEGLRSEILAALDPTAPGALVRIARELSVLLGLATPPSPPFRGATTFEERRRLAGPER